MPKKQKREKLKGPEAKANNQAKVKADRAYQEDCDRVEFENERHLQAADPSVDGDVD